jgi:glycosyltransferase 2 family protein
MTPASRKWAYWALWLVLLVGLLWWALHKAPLQEIGVVLQQLHFWQVAVILVVNTGLYGLVTLRWWIIVRAGAKHVPFLPLLGVRVSVFGISYFTLGPQVGGEPLQVISLQKKYGLSYTRATASVLLDKLLEFLVNFWLLALGLAAIFQAGFQGGSRMPLTAGMLLLAPLALVPPIHLILLSRRRYPVTALLGRLSFLPKKTRLVRFLRAAEWLAGRFCQRHPRALLAALGVSLLAGAGMLVDYTLMLAFLGIHLPFWNTVVGWTAGWLAFLMPLPGGLGALESSQVAALGIFGIPAATALGVVLLMRARDLLIGGLGLALAGQGLSPVKQKAGSILPYRTI